MAAWLNPSMATGVGKCEDAHRQPVRLADGWCWFVLREKYCWLVAELF
jgi:hypothetical protein